MKKLLFIFLLSLLTQNAHAQVELSSTGGGNGGSGEDISIAANQVEMDEISGKIKIFFMKNKAKLQSEFPEFKIDDLIAIYNKTKLKVVSHEVKDKYQITRTCVNTPFKVLCQSSKLDLIKNNIAVLFVLNLHEHLGILGVEKTSPHDITKVEGYKISKRIAKYLVKSSSYDLKFDRPSIYFSKNLWVYTETTTTLKPIYEDFVEECDQSGKQCAQYFRDNPIGEIKKSVEKYLLNINGNGTCTLIMKTPAQLIGHPKKDEVDMVLFDCVVTEKRIVLGEYRRGYSCSEQTEEETQQQDSSESILFLEFLPNQSSEDEKIVRKLLWNPRVNDWRDEYSPGLQKEMGIKIEYKLKKASAEDIDELSAGQCPLF